MRKLARVYDKSLVDRRGDSCGRPADGPEAVRCTETGEGPPFGRDRLDPTITFTNDLSCTQLAKLG